ncbi:MAG: tyrosine-type recombinase/integrase [Pseudonocardiaceae bacterium]
MGGRGRAVRAAGGRTEAANGAAGCGVGPRRTRTTDWCSPGERPPPGDPDRVLDRFHELTGQAGHPRVRLHDLRHLAATLMLTSSVPLALVSKTLRHAQTAITADLYGHPSMGTPLWAPDAEGCASRRGLPRGRPGRRCGGAGERARGRAATTLRSDDLGPCLLSGSACGETAGQTWSRLRESNP